MDIRDLKRECNDLIDELETLQQTDAKLDLRIQELQNCLEKNINSRVGDRTYQGCPTL